MVTMKMNINKRNKRIFWEHKGTYIGMIILIVLSTSSFLGLKTASANIKQQVINNRIEHKLEDANFFFSENLSESDIEIYENLYNLTLQKNKYVEKQYNGATLRIRERTEKINSSVLYEGTDLNASSDIMVDRYFYEAQKLKFGDTISLNDRDYNLCGIFVTPDYLSVRKNESDFMCDGKKFGFCLVEPDTFKSISNGNEKNYYSVIFNEQNEEEFRKALSDKGIILEWTTRTANTRISTFDGEIDSLIMLSKIAPLFILMLSSVIMAVAMGRMLKKEYVYIGTLYSMGYKKAEIISHYTKVPICVSLTGSFLGCILGIFLTKPFSMLSSIEYNIPKLTFHYEILDIVILMIVPITLNLMATVFSLKKALNFNISLLLKANSNSVRRGFLTKFISYKRGTFKLRFRIKEITWNLSRSFLMVVGITASSLFILTGFVFDSSLKVLFNSNFHELFGYEYQYIFTKPIYEPSSIGEPYMVSNFEYDKNGEKLKITLNGVADNSKYITLFDKNGNIIENDQTVISRAVAKRLGIQAGDIIKIKNNSNLEEYNIKINKICDIQYSENIYLPLSELNNMLKLPKDTHIGLYSDKELDLDPSLVMNTLTKEDSIAGMETSITALRSLLYIMAIISAIIGTIVIYIVTSMLIEENKKNISMLKVLGYHNNELSKLLLNSTCLLIWIGFLLSIPLTQKLIQKFFDVLTANMYFDFIVSLKLWQLLISLIFILTVYYITLHIFKRKVLNINMTESLKARD